ncbi:hypothetical protein ATY41_11955 [Leifsonia xyli subsp. xyli]|uniref:Uncharacterized protein n=1 Tax=Leifsonia xyli subsp. xyli TaxID=59736 RepID=A0A1E2SJI5_LEIXY|nr:hypothetical protein ATY41_11955 [Leifsonia xyli subsp. xyli]
MIAVGAIVAAIVVAVKLGFIDLSDKSRRGSGTISGAVGGSFDEIFAPARHEAQQELDRHSLLPAPAPLAGGEGGTGLWEGGKIRLDLGAAGRGQRAEGRTPGDSGRARLPPSRRYTRG